jgi:hypothetical protein
MAEESLKVVIGADVNAGVAGINKFNTALAKVKPGANQATFALTNLSRVAQDAPFGFIGIANNLNPLLESFQRLRKEAGSNKAALSALTSSLVGAGGLGLAIGIASAALSLFSLANNKSGKSAKNAKEEVDEFGAAVGEVSKKMATDVSRVSTLFNALNSGALNLEQRKKALTELAGINNEFFGALKEEKGLINGLEGAYDKYLSKITQISRAKAIESQLTKLFDKKLELELSIDPKFSSAISPETQKQIGRLQDQLKKAGGAVDISKLTGDELFNNAAIEKRIKLQERINELQKGSNVLFDNSVKGGKEFQKTQEQISELQLRINGLLAIQKDTGNFDISGINDSTKKVKEFKENIKELESSIPKTTQQLANMFRIFKLGTGEESGGGIDTDRITLPLKTLADGIEEQTKKIASNKLLENLRLQAEQTATTVSDLLTPAFEGFFNSLLSGSGNPFKAFGDALKQMIAQLAAAIAKAAIFAGIMQLIAPGSGSFGSLFKGALGSLGGLIGGVANGGVNVGNITGSAARGFNVEVTGRMQGTDLLFVTNKVQRQIGRSF